MIGEERYETFSVMCTYIKRARVVEDFLKTCSKYYFEKGIDIYYYDSSPDLETKKIVEDYRKNNVFYVKLPENMPSNMKVFEIFSGYGLKNDYEFLWVCGDAIQYAEAALDDLFNYLDLQYDIVQMDCRDYAKIGNKEYTDYDEYLKDCAWELTLYGSAILNCNTMLRNVDWDYYKMTYNKPNLINFSHVSFYFTKICKLESFKAFHISVNNKYFRSSYLKIRSGWYNDAFFILCEAWVDTIENLPSCYKSKAEAIRRHGKYVMITCPEDIVLLKRQGIYNYIVYKRYRQRLEKVCPVEDKILRKIALLPTWFIDICTKKKRKKNMINRLIKFCEKCGKVYIYGAGAYGHSYVKLLKELNIKYEGYVVTNIGDNPKEFIDGNIYNITDLNCFENIGVIVAVGLNSATGVLENLNRMNIKNIFYEKDLYREIVG